MGRHDHLCDNIEVTIARRILLLGTLLDPQLHTNRPVD